MKKILTVLAILTLYSYNSQSQEELRMDYRERFMIGFKIGANYSNVYDKNDSNFNTDPKFGLATGMLFAIPIGKYFGLQPEILFSQKGFKAYGHVIGNTYVLKRTTNYIDIPLLLTVKVSPLITLLAGSQYSYLISQKNSFENATTTIEQEKAFENENIRKNMLCFTAGLDITLKHIVLGARAGWDVQSNNGDGTSTTPRYKNQWFQATVGYRFFKP
jgi:hypothetical protein